MVYTIKNQSAVGVTNSTPEYRSTSLPCNGLPTISLRNTQAITTPQPPGKDSITDVPLIQNHNGSLQSSSSISSKSPQVYDSYYRPNDNCHNNCQSNAITPNHHDSNNQEPRYVHKNLPSVVKSDDFLPIQNHYSSRDLGRQTISSRNGECDDISSERSTSVNHLSNESNNTHNPRHEDLLNGQIWLKNDIRYDDILPVKEDKLQRIDSVKDPSVQQDKVCCLHSSNVRDTLLVKDKFFYLRDSNSQYNNISCNCGDSVIFLPKKGKVYSNNTQSTSLIFNDSIVLAQENNGNIKMDSIEVDHQSPRIQEAKNHVEKSEELIHCGWGKGICAPKCLQPMANKNMFLLVFCIACALQGMYYTYFVSVLTTMEKLLQIKSKTTGIIMSATEIGQIGGALLLTYYGNQGHRPKWIACGMLLFSFSAFLCASPHFIFGTTLLENHLASTPSEDDPLGTANLCHKPDIPLSKSSMSSSSDFNVSNILLPDHYSDNNIPLVNNSSHVDCSGPTKLSPYVLGIFFVALLGVGIGQTAVYNLGVPYIDDNVANRDSPLYFAVTMGVRIIGPTLGFLLGSLCARIYVNPWISPSFTTKDPRWVGAWWLGHLIVSATLFLTSLVMFMFPKQLRQPIHSGASLPVSPSLNSSAKPGEDYQIATVASSQNIEQQQRSLTGFVSAVSRLLRNKILLLRTASSVFHILPIAGLYTFLPKYLETQFRLTVDTAAIVSGVGGILVMGLGIFSSGIYIRKMSPSPRAVAGWTAFTAAVYSLGMIILMFLGCSSSDIKGATKGSNDEIVFKPLCERSCSACDDQVFEPICSDGHTYFSACHLGCSSLVNNTDNIQYSDCECIADGQTAYMNYCDVHCNNFIWYILGFSLFVIIQSSSEVGGMLVTLRCVQPKDKALALGLIAVAIGVFGNVPCPIIYGAVVDSACIHWKTTCDGQRGACQLYDSYTFRLFFHGTTAGVMFLAFLIDLSIFYEAKNISFDDVEDSSSDESCPEEVVPLQSPMSESCSFAPTSPQPPPPTPAVESLLTATVHSPPQGSEEASSSMDAPLLLKCSTTTSPSSTPVVVVSNFKRTSDY